MISNTPFSFAYDVFISQYIRSTMACFSSEFYISIDQMLQQLEPWYRIGPYYRVLRFYPITRSFLKTFASGVTCHTEDARSSEHLVLSPLQLACSKVNSSLFKMFLFPDVLHNLGYLHFTSERGSKHFKHVIAYLANENLKIIRHVIGSILIRKTFISLP